MSDRLADSVAVVTGGGAHTDRVFGIGEATCRLFAEEGATVVVVDVTEAMVDRTVEALREETDAEIVGVPTDLTDESSVEALASVLDERFGGVDVLVNNAGIRIPGGPITELDTEDWDRIFDVNLRGMALACKHLIPLMQDDGGSIVNVSSANAEIGRRGWSAYDATKAGVLAFTRDLACDHAADGIRVNSVLPGPTVTDYHLDGVDDPEAEIEARTSSEGGGPGILNRSGHPRELAYGILFLASDDSSFVTGAAIPVDGGLTATG